MREERAGALRWLAGWGALLAATYVFWRWVVPYTLPFWLAAVLALAVLPLARRWEPRLGASLAAGAALLLAVGGGTLAVGLVLGLIARELARLAARIPHDLEFWRRLWMQWVAPHPLLSGWLEHSPLSPLAAGNGAGNVTRVAEGVIRTLLETIGRLPDLLLLTLVSVMAAFFVLRDQRRWRASFARLVAPRWRRPLAAALAEMWGGLRGFVRAQCMLLAVTALATGTGLALVGSPYAVLGGVVAGLLDLLPYLGPTGLLLPWSGLLLAQGQRVAAARIAAVMVAVVLVRQLVEPRVVGDNMGLHPLTVLVALYVGIRIFGAAGFIVGPISAVMVKAMARSLHLLPG